MIEIEFGENASVGHFHFTQQTTNEQLQEFVAGVQAGDIFICETSITRFNRLLQISLPTPDNTTPVPQTVTGVAYREIVPGDSIFYAYKQYVDVGYFPLIVTRVNKS